MLYVFSLDALPARFWLSLIRGVEVDYFLWEHRN